MNVHVKRAVRFVWRVIRFRSISAAKWLDEFDGWSEK